MDTTYVSHKIKLAEKDIVHFLDILASDTDSIDIAKQIQKLNLLQTIQELHTLGTPGIQLVPLLLRILLRIVVNDKLRNHLDLLKAIISLLGFLRPDGFISEYAFIEVVHGTPFTIHEIFQELTQKEYIQGNILSPRFKPMEDNFHLEIDPKYHSLEQNIIKTLLSISTDIPVTEALVSLLKDKNLTSLYSDIVHALVEIGHPAAFPILLRINHDAAHSGLISIALRDIHELKELLEQNVTEDMWGNKLTDKVLESVSTIFPLLFEVLTSDDYTIDEKKLICFFLNETGIRRKEDFELFSRILPLLYQEDPKSCYVTSILITGGVHTVSHVISVLEKELEKKGTIEIHILNRFLYILSHIGSESKSALPVLMKLADETDYMTESLRETINAIKPYDEEKKIEKKIINQPEQKQENNKCGEQNIQNNKTSSGGIDDETGQLIDKIQKESIETNPEDYVLY